MPFRACLKLDRFVSLQFTGTPAAIPFSETERILWSNALTFWFFGRGEASTISRRSLDTLLEYMKFEGWHFSQKWYYTEKVGKNHCLYLTHPVPRAVTVQARSLFQCLTTIFEMECRTGSCVPLISPQPCLHPLIYQNGTMTKIVFSRERLISAERVCLISVVNELPVGDRECSLPVWMHQCQF